MQYLNAIDSKNIRLCVADIIDWEECKWNISFGYSSTVIRYDNGCNIQLSNFLWQVYQNKRGPFTFIGNIYENLNLLMS